MSHQGLVTDEIGKVVWQRRASFLPNAIRTLYQKVQWAVNWSEVTFNLGVVLTKEEEGGYTAYSPEMKGARTQGEDEDETLSNMAEVISLMLCSLRKYAPFVMWYQSSR